MTPLLPVTVQKQGFAETEYLKNGEKLPAIVHMILAFVVKKESETITDKSNTMQFSLNLTPTWA